MVEAVLGAIVIVAALVWRLSGVAVGAQSVEVELWQLVTYGGASFLAIGLVRDVAIKLRARGAKPVRAGEKLICFESVAGALLVAAGLALLALGVVRPFALAPATIAMLGGALLIASGFTKDVVMVFRREKDHVNLIPW